MSKESKKIPLTDFAVSKALDFIISEVDVSAVYDYLDVAAIEDSTFISIYLLKMVHRLDLLDVDAKTRDKALADITKIAIMHERKLYEDA